MSDINLDFTVSNNSINFTVEPNDITITPEEIQLTFNANFQPLAGGSNTQLQYNLNGTLDGIPNVTYNGSNLSLGNVANLKITGGTNGYFLQTDGTGNLDWAVGGGGGNGTPGGSNTQIQYNDNGSFGGNTGFTFNEVSGNVNMPGNLIVAGNITGSFNSNYANFAGNVVNNSQPNITTVGTLTLLDVVGTITASAITANTGIISGNGAGISNITGANVTGTVANATYALSAGTAGTVTTNAQPNITSVGTLSNLSVTGNITTSNLNISNIANIVIGIENITIIGAQTGTFNFDVLTSPIRFSSANAASNLILNVRGNSTTTFNSLIAVGQSMTTTYVLTTGATGYIVSSIDIDGSAQTVKYSGTAVAVANCATAYTYTIIKTAATPTYTVLGSITRYI
jgi:hypothetical protein